MPESELVKRAVMEFADEIQAYYNSLKGYTIGPLVAFFVKQKANEYLEKQEVSRDGERAV